MISQIQKLASSFILIVLSLTSLAQSMSPVFHEKISGFVNSANFKHAGIGISITDIQSGEVFSGTKTQPSLVPASILKLVTTATALEVFGPQHRFSTFLNYSGTISNDTLWGDLQVIGGGDPTLGSAHFPEQANFWDQWIQAIRSSGIRVITGNLIFDATIFDNQTIPNTWSWEDIGNYFGAGSSGLSVYDNQYAIQLRSGEQAGQPTQIVRIEPEIPGLEIRNEVVSSTIQKDLAYVYGSPLDNLRLILGTIPNNRSNFSIYASVPDPPALLANEFRKKLIQNQIAFSGELLFRKAKDGVLLAKTESPELHEIIRITNFESVNLFAEHLLKQLAARKTGLGSTEDGCKFIVKFWTEKGIDLSGFYMSDGSGLSRFNACTAKQMTDMLVYMSTQSKHALIFKQSLPGAGEGTLRNFSKAAFPNESLRAKSGSMTRVKCYAGYLNSASGKEFSFTIMLNNFSGSQAEAGKKIEEILVELRKM